MAQDVDRSEAVRDIYGLDHWKLLEMNEKSKNLLERDEFRTQVFLRDKNCCVMCGKPAQDAHHIVERKLFPDGGYYINNGASLCGECHLKAEMTLLSVEEIRAACGIPESKKILPPAYYDDQSITKWGDPILSNGLRMRGELFDDVNVQRILEQGKVLHLYTKYAKYPRTWHLPWSPGTTSDDRLLESTDFFNGKEVVVTVKMDGENTTMYDDYIHARSTADKKHWSKSWIKNFHARIAHEIPADWRIVVENLFAEHSIHYKDLESYCYGISIWDGKNICLSWDDTVEFFRMLGIHPVPVLYRGTWDESLIRGIHKAQRDGNDCEGYVVRLADSFSYGEFAKSVAKYVRKGHVRSGDHWFYGKVGSKNDLKEQKDVCS